MIENKAEILELGTAKNYQKVTQQVKWQLKNQTKTVEERR